MQFSFMQSPTLSYFNSLSLSTNTKGVLEWFNDIFHPVLFPLPFENAFPTGSVAKGTDIRSSDLDLVCVFSLDHERKNLKKTYQLTLSIIFDVLKPFCDTKLTQLEKRTISVHFILDNKQQVDLLVAFHFMCSHYPKHHWCISDHGLIFGSELLWRFS